jgi:uncharacterized protein (TIGR02452 family)
MQSISRNIEVWEDTVKKVLDANYPVTPSIFHINLSLYHQPRYSSTIIDVVPMDTLSCCHALVSQGSVMGLNMASHQTAGGGVVHGAPAQEENCFRRSNYFQVLSQNYYPLPEKATIYSPSVIVIKDQSYQLLQQPFAVAMVACAALRHPPLKPNGQFRENYDREMMKFKIQQIFQVGYNYGHEILVLGAFGCGAFGNNPSEVTLLFNEVIKEYYGCFKMIVFAVLSRGENNFKVFKEQILTNNCDLSNQMNKMQI